MIRALINRFFLGGRNLLERAGVGFLTGSYPRYLSIAVINDCNYRCPYCFGYFPIEGDDPRAGAKKKYVTASIDLKVFKKLIDALVSFGRPIKVLFNYGGSIMLGEPFLHPEFLQMCKYVKKVKFGFSVLTNGSLMSEKSARELIDLGVENVCISLNASSPRVYREITGASSDVCERIHGIVRGIS